MAEDNKRDHLRVAVDTSTDVYVTISNGTLKQKVLDISDGGVCFTSLQKLIPGENYRIYLHFPWLKDSIEVSIKAVRVTAVTSGDDDAQGSSEEEADAEKKKPTWGVASRYVALTMGLEDKLFREVRKLERHLIAEAENNL